ncbi:putative oxygen-independent coproporphyrinogen III oxidase [Anaerolinea thermolimosa]|uniref:radical SAM family heme chaperone HemW n=1 Tax=Anaerolinea thermolimosa TaxID=229919 RepID=UPI0007829C84|nr:radical SAM family heme chaperone HemW [Anaerolinea thermolimosa]GAP05881.1 putative oxygen-independent coproporphyrinogen III oxidase [Anaerolinea thermolimosa]
MDAHSLYLHIPFCQKRCAYCDFNTFAGLENTIPAYVNALCREMRLVAASLPYRLPVHTLFFGGGTPSLLSVEQVATILETAATVFDVSPRAEITLEANPGTVTRETLRGLRRLGVNRLSFGVQSAHPEELAILTRLHDYSDVIRSVQWAREAGFENLNLDLMFGLPGQTLERWQRTLELVLGLRPEHLSLYCLTIEKGTPFFRWSARGLLEIPDDDLAADMYEHAMDRLGEAGFIQYEISNWARPSGEGTWYSCRHNLQYWRGLPYLGMGAGAHGYAGGFRTANVKPVPHYIQRCQLGESQPFPRSPANDEFHPVSVQDEMAEMMMVGLRLTEEGISEEVFQHRFGKNLREVYRNILPALEQQGLIEWAGQNHDHLRLTRRGRLLGNRVFSAFL